MDVVLKQASERNRSEKGTFRTGKPISSQAREIILNVYKFMSTIHQLNPRLKFPQKVTAEACGVSSRTVQRILKETSGGERPESPGKKRPNRKATVTSLNEEAKCTLRHLIYNMSKKGTVPTSQALLDLARERVGFKGQRTSLCKVIKGMGFKFIKQKGRKLFQEGMDIVTWRRCYLRLMKENSAMDSPRPVAYVYETIFAVQTPENSRQSNEESASNSGKPSPSKMAQFVVYNAGTKSGLVPNASLWLYCPARQEGPPIGFTEDNFTAWFENMLLPNVPPEALIVMESAPYHNHQFNELPTKKTDIRKWLTKYQIPFGMEMSKSELLNLVQSSHLPDHHVIDNLAEVRGHKVVRLPPSHCDLNPIEEIGAKAKAAFAMQTATISSISEVEGLWNSALQQITPQEWDQCYSNAERVAQKYCDQDDFDRAYNSSKEEKGCRMEKLPDVCTRSATVSSPNGLKDQPRLDF